MKSVKTDTNILNSENAAWLTDFKQKHGRSPRILHIGNIANNAYNNAKLLNEAGLDCDVICYDYYHIMGCPEWEDADFEGEITDQFKPDWTKLNLNGFERPRWFAQGPVVDCIDYLIERREKESLKADYLWNKLSILSNSHHSSELRWKLKLQRCMVWLQHRNDRFIRGLSYLSNGHSIAFRIASSCYAGRLSGFAKTEIVRLFIAWVLIVVAIAVRIFCFPFRYLIKTTVPEASLFDDRVADIINVFSSSFPARADRLTAADMEIYRTLEPRWYRLFEHYDLVQGYATAPILPLIAGKKPYSAFEHGTLRSIPYEENPQGRLCAISYKHADHIFVTNFDCLESARYLAPGNFTLLNHPYDEDQPEYVASDWQSQRAKLLEGLQADFLLFHPTRHDWVEGTGYADKGNDLLLHSFGKLVKHHGLKLGLVCCDWGGNVENSKALLEKYGVSNHVTWVKPLGIVAYTRMCKAAHIVVDQFKLGAFGGVTFKALAAAAPVMIYLDEERIVKQYPEIPPVINCSTEAEILEQISYWYYHIDALADLGLKGRGWMKRNHSKSDTINRQIDVLRKLI